MKKGRGFTLVELLAVIVILGIILVIAIPSISGVIENSKKGAFATDAKMIIKAIEYEKLEDENFDPTTVDLDYVSNNLNLDTTNYASLTVTVDGENKVNVEITGQGQWDSLEATGTYKSMTVSEVVPDTTPPVITYEYSIMTPDHYLLCRGAVLDEGNFESSASAIDDIDGVISDEIVFDYSSLNTNVIGDYNINATVSDNSGNESNLTILIRISCSGFCDC